MGKIKTASTTFATAILRQLSADDIRRRLSELDGEERALRTLLRAAIRMEAEQPKRQGATNG